VYNFQILEIINRKIIVLETESRAVFSTDTMVSQEYAAPIFRAEVTGTNITGIFCLSIQGIRLIP
jgi:hypothetical protein